ncbi:MAG TPA: BamA/TamA family outer membrane protein [Gemmatimonadales bacterium]|nr:BamA/TamA family outer membrane protein [Gemmatimonadales bacterium]
MRTDRIVVMGVLTWLSITSGLNAQDPLTTIGPATQVRSIEFRFIGRHTLDEEEVRAAIALTERGGLIWLRNAFGWLPFISSVGEHPFDPLVLQRDVVRLRHYYERKGFPDAEIDYDVRYDAEPDLVDVTFVIREGPPLLLAGINFVGVDNSPPLVAPELKSSWQRLLGRLSNRRGRFTEDDRLALADRTTRWLRDRGYPLSVTRTAIRIDSAANRVAVIVRVEPGPRTRIRKIEVTGNPTVPAQDFTRQFPIQEGDWYDASRLERGRQRLMQLDLVRLALLRVPRKSIRDSTVVVELQVTENPPRMMRGEIGVASGGGIGGQGDWTHRSFLGGLRTLVIGGAAQTGVVSLESPPQEEYRLGVSIFQPYVFDRRVSLAGGPFGEYRNDIRERSWRIGLESALVFASGPLRSIALGYAISHRRILDYGFANELEPIEYLPLLGLADSASVGQPRERFDRSVLTLHGSWGRLDRFANPREGYVIRPRIEVTTPFLTTNEYVLFELGATGFLPINDRVGVTLRGSAGRIYPFGRSLRNTGNQSPFVSLLQLRDATFTAGGTRDVRGWGTQLLGPKLPKIELQSGAGGAVPTADQYSPLGGLARIQSSAELHLPIPGMSDRWQSFFFLDGARVWTPDSRFHLDGGDLVDDRFFFGTGAGIGYETVVGAIQVALGYKLNPSALDVRDPNDVVNAVVNGRPLSSVPIDSRRRWHLHFSIGATF